jgi:hypothetical protein
MYHTTVRATELLERQWRAMNHGTHQARPVSGRVADLAARQHRQLALDPGRRVARRRDKVQRANTLAVQSSVLREALHKTRICVSSFAQSRPSQQA